MKEGKSEFSIYIKKIRTNSNTSPVITEIEQKVYYVKNNNGRCDFTVDDDIRMEDIPVEKIIQCISEDKKWAIENKLDYFTILSDNQGKNHRFCLHFEY